MDLYPEFKAILRKQQIHEPTAIQKDTANLLRENENVIGLAKTGTGKTLAYSLPIIGNVRPGDANSFVIFEPTTELAIQVRDVLLPFAKQLGLRTIALVGAGNRQRQLEVLKKKHPEIIIATPGRFFDMLTENRIVPDQIKHLVIDEADDILEATKLDLIASLGRGIERTSQIVLFGATESQITLEADEIFERDFIKVDVRHIDESRVEHLFLQVDNAHKVDTIKRLSRADNFWGIVFFNSIARLEQFAGILSHTNISFEVLSNAASKQSRRNALKSLEEKRVKLLLATDLAARGIDIKKLSYVINYELPEDLNTYTHRAGRTGRVGRKGYVVSLGTDHDFRDFKKMLEEQIDIKKAYFSGRELTTTRPKKRTRNASMQLETPEVEINHNGNGDKKMRHNVSITSNDLRTTKRKNRRKNTKNKGYHPHGAKKKEGNNQ